MGKKRPTNVMSSVRHEMFKEIHGRKIHPKKSTPNKKVHLDKFLLNNFRWVPDSCHREEGKSSCEFFEKVRANAVFFGISGFLVSSWVPKNCPKLSSQALSDDVRTSSSGP